MGKKYEIPWTEATLDYIITEPYIGNRSDVPDFLDRLIERADTATGASNISGEISAWAGSPPAALAVLQDAVDRNNF
jgi:hypothetical protein